MASNTPNRRSSLRRSTANISNITNLPQMELRRNTKFVNGTSTENTPNFITSNSRRGSTLFSADNTAIGIARARKQFLEEQEETPRTIFLDLGKRVRGSENGEKNPLDNLNVINADLVFQQNKNNTRSNKPLLKPNPSVKINENTSESLDKQDSINDPHDSLLMYSGAKETSNKSTINDGNRKLRRVVRSLKSAPLLDMSNSVVSENENQTASLDDDPADIREFDIQEKENDFTKRPLPLKRRVTRKSSRQKAMDNSHESPKATATGNILSREDVAVSSFDDQETFGKELMDSLDDTTFVVPTSSQGARLTRRSRKTRTAETSDPPIEANTPSSQISLEDKYDENDTDEGDDLSTRPDVPRQNELLLRNKKSSRAGQAPLVDNNEVEIGSTYLVSDEMDTQSSSLYELMLSDTEYHKKLTTPDGAIKSNQLRTRIEEIKKRKTANYLEDLGQLQPNLSNTVENSRNNQTVNKSKDRTITNLGSMQQGMSSSSDTVILESSKAEISKKVLHRRYTKSPKLIAHKDSMQSPSIAGENILHQSERNEFQVSEEILSSEEPLNQLPSSNPASPKSLHKTTHSVTQGSLLEDTSKVF